MIKSLNTPNKHESTSSKYQHVNTSEFNEVILNMGYNLDSASEVKSRKESKIGFGKHLLNYSLPDSDQGDYKPTLHLLNSHDGSTSARVFIGAYRFICANGLMLGSTYYESRLRHVGPTVLSDLRTAIDAASNHYQVMLTDFARLATIELTDSARIELIDYSASLVLPESTVDFATGTVDNVIRLGDQGNDLFSLYNRIQEKVINGGIKYISRNDDGKCKHNTTRKVKSIDRQISLNQDLYSKVLEVAS